jgi:diguanylate cyclase (GGDEF)-like protein/PAS domain S-box-containing protein
MAQSTAPRPSAAQLQAAAPAPGRRPSPREGSAIVDERGRFVGVGPALARGLGRDPKRLIGVSLFEFVHPDDLAKTKCAFAALWADSSRRTTRCRFRSAGGRWAWTEATASIVTRAGGRSEALVMARPARAPAAMEGALRQPITGADLPAAVHWDVDFHVTAWSDGAEALLGYSADEMLGKDALRLLAAPGYRSAVAGLRHRLLAERCGHRQTMHAIAKGGRTVVCEWHHAPLLDAVGDAIGFASHATEYVAAPHARVTRNARLRDPLTGVASPELFADRLERALASGVRSRGDLAVFVVDVDAFAQVNRSFGHRAGDELLRAVAERLSRALRDTDSLGRVGGDRFAALIVRPGGAAGAEAAARRMLACFAEPFPVETRSLVQTASVGISLFPGDAHEATVLLQRAQAAMHRAKELGRDAYQFFADSTFATGDGSLAHDLRLAVQRGEIETHFQPQIDLRTGAVAGAASLVRWRHPQRGLLAPKEFVALAEETGSILAIGRTVLGDACKAMRTWQDAGVSIPRVTVNVSGRELRRRLVDDVAKALCDTDLDPNALELELTETVTMVSDELHPRLLEELKSFGVRLAVDDFGVGSSSISHLQRFPIDTLKIDRVFVEECLTNRMNRTIVEAIVAIAHGLDLEVVAEGVETREQEEFLRSLGCDRVQGYLYSPPLPPDEFAAFLANAPSFAPKT